MRNRWLLAVAGVAAVCVLMGAQAQARWTPPDPAEVADHLTQHVTRIADRCVARNGMVADRIVAKIEAAIWAGDPELAERIGQVGIGVIDRSSEICTRVIERTCRFGTRILDLLGAEQSLIDDFQAVCDAKVQEIAASQAKAVGAIQDALALIEELPVF